MKKKDVVRIRVNINFTFCKKKYLRKVQSVWLVLVTGSLSKDDRRRIYNVVHRICVTAHTLRGTHLKLRVAELPQGCLRQPFHVLDTMKKIQHTGKLKE